MNDLTKPKKQRSLTVIEPTYSELLRVVMKRNNGTQAGIDALKAVLERNEQERKQASC